MNKPSYIQTFEKGLLAKKTDEIFELLKECTLCPHKCVIDRTKGVQGICRSCQLPIVSSHQSHFGEESCLVGRAGSGTIFFTNCNLSCIFCQNFDISHYGNGREVSYEDLAEMMLLLQSRKSHNINLVTPTHMIYAILRALLIAIPRGLEIPLVYNCGGYEEVQTIKLLNGIIDIYMPDLKYMNSTVAENLSGAKNYRDIVINAIKEMHQQVGDLQVDDKGIAYRGLIVRHLVLPNNIAATDRVIDFIASLSKNTYINIMDQYRPTFRSRECFDMRRRITIQEYDDAVGRALKAGLSRIN